MGKLFSTLGGFLLGLISGGVLSMFIGPPLSSDVFALVVGGVVGVFALTAGILTKESSQ